MKPRFIRLYQALIVTALIIALPAGFIADTPRPWWGVVLAALPMALHFSLRLSFRPRPRTRWLMPQQVFTLGGLGLTMNPDLIDNPSWFATGLATALVICLYVYLVRFWSAGD